MDFIDVSCPICFENFTLEKLPYTLKCGHTICNLCLHKRDKAIKEENEEDEEDEESEDDSIMIKKCLVCRSPIDSRLKEQPVNISLISNFIKANPITYCENCCIFNDYSLTNNIDKCLKLNHKILTLKCFKDKIKEYISFYKVKLNEKNVKDKITQSIKFVEQNKKLLEEIVINKYNLINTHIQKYTNELEILDIKDPNNLTVSDFVKLSQSKLVDKKKQIYNYYLKLNYVLKSLKNKKAQNQIKDDFTKTMSSSYSYFLLGSKSLEKIFTVQYIVNTKKIKIYKADEAVSSEIKIDTLTGVFNESIRIEIDSEGKYVYLIGGSFDDEVAGTQFYSIDISERTPILKKLNSLIYERRNPGVCYYNNKIFAIGGEKDDEGFSECEYYDVIKGKWIELPSLNSEIMEPGVCVLKNILYCCGVTSFVKMNFESLNLKSMKEWKNLGVEIKDPIVGHLVVPYDFCNLIIFGGCRVNEEEEDYYYNDNLYLVNIYEKSYTKLISKENDINSEFSTVPSFYKNKIIGFDFPESEEPKLFTYDIATNKFSTN